MGKPKFKVESGDASVVAVRFSHGSIDVKKDQSKMSWQLYKRKLASSSREKKESILAAEIDGMSYTARNFAKDQTDDMCDYYMGVIDEETDKMRVFPADFFTMQPVIEDTDAAENKATNRDWRAKTDDLVKEFGSGRMQRAVNKRQKNKLDDEMLSTVTQAVANTSVLEQQSSQEGEGPSGRIVTVTSAVPPHNMDALRPEDVYKLSDIIVPDISQPLNEMCIPLYNATNEDIEAWAREKTYPHFILAKLPTLSIREEARLIQCQCLTYLDCLMKMFKMKGSSLRVRDPLPNEWHFLVKKHIFSSFCVETRNGKSFTRTCPSQLKDKMLSQILILCLKLSLFSLELNPLLADLGIPKRRLMIHCQILGCLVKTVKNPLDKADPTFIASLSVPLKFPELKKPTGKKKFM